MADGVGEGIDIKTYSDEVFFGKPFPSLANVDFVRGDKAELKTKGVISVFFILQVFYKGGFIVNEELTQLAEKFKDVQFVAIANDPEKEKIEKLLVKIKDGSCCDPVTKQVFRLDVPFVGHDNGKVLTKALANTLNASVLHAPHAFIVDTHGNIAWRQSLLQNYNFSASNFADQLTAVLAGKAVAQPNGTRPKADVTGEAAEVDDEMSLF